MSRKAIEEPAPDVGRWTLDVRRRRLHRFAVLVAGCTFVLIVAGALVTSNDAGLSVPDWPTSYGWNMFTFPPSQWVGGVRFEHVHRLIASTVGLLTILLFVALLRWEDRRSVRRLGGAALAAVVAQGVLGGLTVVFLLPAPISVGHACLAQTFFCLVVAIAVMTGRGWAAADGPMARWPDEPIRARRHVALSLATFAAITIQLVLGALVRHMRAQWGSPLILLHVGTAIAVAALALAAAARVHRLFGSDERIRRPASLLVALVLAQLLLGAATVASGRAVAVATAHVALGALTLATSLVLALRLHRIPSPVARRLSPDFVAQEALS